MKIFILLLFISVFIISCDSNENSSSDVCTSNPCADSKIPHKTICKLIDDNDFECICESGYFTDNGSCKKEEVKPCEPNPCIIDHKTICIEDNNTYKCLCDEGYYQNNEECLLEPICNENSCTEIHKTVCDIKNHKIKCSCDIDFTENQEGICEESHDFKIRIMAANITSGRKQSYKANGIRMFQALKPDIILIQEFNYLDEYDDNLPIRDFVNIAFGIEFNYFRGTGRLPNGVISKYPIIESGNWNDSSIDDRSIVWVKIKLPNNKFLWAVSVHLSTKNNLTGAKDSIKEILEKNIPSDDYIVYGGDFNTKSRTSGTITELAKVFNVSAPWPKGYNNFSDIYTCYKCYINYESAEECGTKFDCDVSATSYERDDPYDWIIADKNNLHKLQVPTIYCSENNTSDCLVFDDGLVFDSRDFSQSLLNTYFSPILKGDCDRCIKASYGDDEAYYREGCDRENNDDYMNFQHMAVVKDFLISD